MTNENDPFATFSEDAFPGRFKMPDGSQRDFRPSNTNGDAYSTFTEGPSPKNDESICLRPGDLFDGRFELVKVIGRGAMGEVWLAHELLKSGEWVRDVVVKVVPRNIRNLEMEIERIRATFRTVSALSHPHVCPVHYLGVDDRFGYFLVMKYIVGRDLSDFVADYRKRNKTQPALDDMLPMLRQVASALDYAHGKGVIHRDVKPRNIFYSEEDGAQLIDFGLAEPVKIHTKNKASATSVSGTVVYMSPEQLQGQHQDNRSDQYSFAATVYELLTGQPPFVSSSYDILLDRILHDPIMPVRNVSASVNDALSRALAKNRSERFGNCTEFVKALEEKSESTTTQSSFSAHEEKTTTFFEYKIQHSSGGFGECDIRHSTTHEYQNKNSPSEKPFEEHKAQHPAASFGECDIRYPAIDEYLIENNRQAKTCKNLRDYFSAFSFGLPVMAVVLTGYFLGITQNHGRGDNIFGTIVVYAAIYLPFFAILYYSKTSAAFLFSFISIVIFTLAISAILSFDSPFLGILSLLATIVAVWGGCKTNKRSEILSQKFSIS